MAALFNLVGNQKTNKVMLMGANNETAVQKQQDMQLFRKKENNNMDMFCKNDKQVETAGTLASKKVDTAGTLASKNVDTAGTLAFQGNFGSVSQTSATTNTSSSPVRAA